MSTVFFLAPYIFIYMFTFLSFLSPSLTPRKGEKRIKSNLIVLILMIMLFFLIIIIIIILLMWVKHLLIDLLVFVILAASPVTSSSLPQLRVPGKWFPISFCLLLFLLISYIRVSNFNINIQTHYLKVNWKKGPFTN